MTLNGYVYITDTECIDARVRSIYIMKIALTHSIFDKIYINN